MRLFAFSLTRVCANVHDCVRFDTGDDLVVRMCDCESARRVRTFSGPSDRITDLEVTADGRCVGD